MGRALASSTRWVGSAALLVVALSMTVPSATLSHSAPATTPIPLPLHLTRAQGGGLPRAPSPLPLIPFLPQGASSAAGLPGAKAVPAAATGAPTWIEICATCQPSARSYGGMTWDNGDNYALMFGGENGASADGDTWTYSASAGWSQICSSCSPSGRAEPGMAYDSTDSRVVMFGGCTGISASSTCNMGDSWTYAQGTWTKVSGSLPTLALAVSMADDPADGEVVMFGGCSQFNIDILNPSSSACGSTDYLDTTSVYTAASGWTTIAPATSPNAMEASGMAYDPVLKEDILFGGYDGVHEYSNTWAFHGGDWYNITPSVSPPAMANGVMFWDWSTQSIILSQGDTAAGDVGDTWSFSGGSWTPLYPIVRPTPRDGVVSAAPPSGSLPIIFSGSTNSSSMQDTWAFGTQLAATVAATPLATDVGQTVTFSSSISGGQTPYSISWAFGDGGTATTANATHAYSSAKTYTATLTVTDALGQTATQSLQVNISALPTVAAAASPLIGGTGNSTSFWANATGGTPPLSYLWDFGDGCTAPCSTSATPTHVYTGPGNYSAHVTVVDGAGVSASSSVTVEVKAPKGAVVPSFTASPTTGTAPLWVNFTSSVYGGTPPYTLHWDFGDSSPVATAPTVAHEYLSGGTFAVNLTATDSLGHSGSYHLSIVVKASPMTLTVSASPTHGDAPLPVTLNEVLQGGMAPFNYSWNFGDGSPPGTNSTPTHTYRSAGNYTATFTVRDNPTDGKAINASLSVQIAPPLTVAVPRIPSSPSPGVSGTYSVTVTGGAPPYTYLWDFGDGTGTTNAGPSSVNSSSEPHSYAAAGNYHLTVWVVDANGGNASGSIAVTVGGVTGPSGGGGGSGGIGGSFGLFSGPLDVVFLLLPIITVGLLAAAVFLSVEGPRRRRRANPPYFAPPPAHYSEPAYYPGAGWR